MVRVEQRDGRTLVLIVDAPLGQADGLVDASRITLGY